MSVVGGVGCWVIHMMLTPLMKANDAKQTHTQLINSMLHFCCQWELSKERDKERKFWKGVFSQKIIIINIFLRGLLQSTFPDVVFVKVYLSHFRETHPKAERWTQVSGWFKGFFFFFFFFPILMERGETQCY